jgi:hypothetical protein
VDKIARCVLRLLTAAPTKFDDQDKLLPVSQHKAFVDYTIEDCQAHAAAKNGACLSDKYEHSLAPLQWRCEQGHVWMAAWGDVHREEGTWCKTCTNAGCSAGEEVTPAALQHIFPGHLFVRERPEWVKKERVQKYKKELGHYVLRRRC